MKINFNIEDSERTFSFEHNGREVTIASIPNHVVRNSSVSFELNDGQIRALVNEVLFPNPLAPLKPKAIESKVI